MLNTLLTEVAESTPSVSTAAEALIDGDATRLGVIIGSVVFGVLLTVSLILTARATKRHSFGVVVGVLLGAGFALLSSWVTSVSADHDQQALNTAVEENVAVHYNVTDISTEDAIVRNENTDAQTVEANVEMTMEDQTELSSLDMVYDPELDMMVPMAVDAMNNMPLSDGTMTEDAESIE